MIHNRPHILDIRVDIRHRIVDLGEQFIGHLPLLDTLRLILIAHHLNPRLLIVAQWGQAPGKNHNGIPLHNKPPALPVGSLVEEVGPVLVSDSGGTVGRDLDLIEDVDVGDIDIGDASQPTTETNPRDMQLVQPRLPPNLNKIVRDIGPDLIPHTVVGLLNLTLLTGIGILDLERIEDILPHIQQCVGVPEGQHHEIGVDAQDALDVDDGLLDDVGVQGTVGLVADFAGPQLEVVVVADDQGVGQGHLVGVGEGEGEGEQEGEQEGFGEHMLGNYYTEW